MALVIQKQKLLSNDQRQGQIGGRAEKKKIGSWAGPEEEAETINTIAERGQESHAQTGKTF